MALSSDNSFTWEIIDHIVHIKWAEKVDAAEVYETKERLFEVVESRGKNRITLLDFEKLVQYDSSALGLFFLLLMKYKETRQIAFSKPEENLRAIFSFSEYAKDIPIYRNIDELIALPPA